MMLRWIIENVEPIKVKVVAYAKDGNTVVIHHEKVHPVTSNAGIFCMKPDAYGQFAIVVVAYYACGYGVQVTGLSRHDMDEELLLYRDPEADDWIKLPPEEAVRRICLPYATEELYLQNLDAKARCGQYIQAIEIRLAEELLRSAPKQGAAQLEIYREARQRYQEAQERKRLKAQEERRQREKAKRQEEDARWKQRVDDMLEKLRQDDQNVLVDVEAIFFLAKEYAVNIPISVKGWMRRSLVAISIINGRVTTFKYQKSPSNTFHVYLAQLIAAIRKESKEDKHEPLL